MSGTGGSGGTDAGPSVCGDPYVGYGTQRLVASYPTAQAFIDAYNAEVQNGSGAEPGQLLVVVDYASDKAWFGPAASAGAGYALDTPYDSATFTPQFDVSPKAAVTLELDVGGAQIPIRYLSSVATVGTGCHTIEFDALMLTIPADAGGVAFHGSTLSALLGNPKYLGPPTDGGPPPTVDGSADGATDGSSQVIAGWEVKLVGVAQDLDYQGGTP